jgi:altronate hydrolase
MLLDIAKLPTAENSAIHLHPTDNVAVARVPIAAGTELRVDGIAVRAAEAIPAGHKIALRAVAAGEMVRRYGQAIGPAARRSRPASTYTRTTFRSRSSPCGTSSSAKRRFWSGRATCRRFRVRAEDGRAGTRNYIAVAAASNCARTGRADREELPGETPLRTWTGDGFPHL